MGKISKRALIVIFLAVTSCLAVLSKIWIGFDIDEAYAVSMPYRLVQGDFLFRDMWEIHQTSSFLPYFFIYIFEELTGGTEYLVLYLRIAATLIHTVMSFLVYRMLSKEAGLDKQWSLLVGLLYLNFLPKWMMSLDFSMQLIWCLTLLVICLYHGIEKKSRLYIFGGGLALAMAVLAYPGMLVVYPVCLLAIFKLQKVKSRINYMLIFTAGAAVAALGFLIYILLRMPPGELIASLPYVFSDGSHQYDFVTKMQTFGRQWAEVFVQGAILIIPAAIMAWGICYAVKRHSQGQNQEHSKNKEEDNFWLAFLLTFLALCSIIIIFANLFGISWGPFRLQVRYLILFAFAFILEVKYKEKKCEDAYITWLLLAITAACFAGVLISSNVGPVSSSSYLVIGIIASVILFKRYAEIKNKEKIAFYVVSLFVFSLIMCKGYYVRVSEYPPANIWETRERIPDGPAKGIYVYPADCERMSGDFITIRENTQAEDRLLFMGTESLSNLYGRGTFVSPTTISTPAFNEQWVTYFTMYPGKQPTVIFLAKNTIDDREKFFAQNPFGIWIAANYDVENRIETDSLCVIRK